MIYIDGQYYENEQAKISVFDHGLLYGDGVFEGIRVYDNRIFRLKEHLLRLYESAKVIALRIPLSMDEMESALIETIKRNGFSSCYIRLVVTRGYGDMGLDPAKCPAASVIIVATQITIFSPERYELGLEVCISSVRRVRDDSLSPRVKSLNYLSNVMAKIEANRQGIADTIMLNQNGHVTEASVANVFIVKNGVLITPPKYLGILEGVTRNTVMEVAASIGITVKEEPFNTFDLYTADECFLTGTAAEVIAVVSVDGRVIGDKRAGATTKRLLELFRARTAWDGVVVK